MLSALFYLFVSCFSRAVFRTERLVEANWLGICVEVDVDRIRCKKIDGDGTFYHNTLRAKLSALGI